MTALKDRRTDCRNGAIFRAGLSVRNEELMPSNMEFGGAQTAAHVGVSPQYRPVSNLSLLRRCDTHTQ